MGEGYGPTQGRKVRIVNLRLGDAGGERIRAARAGCTLPVLAPAEGDWAWVVAVVVWRGPALGGSSASVQSASLVRARDAIVGDGVG